MKVRTRFVKTEMVPTGDGYYSYIQMDYSQDGREWKSIGTNRKYTDGTEKPDGGNLAMNLQTTLQARVDAASDKIAELRAIRAELSC